MPCQCHSTTLHALSVSLHYAERPDSITPPRCTPFQCHSTTLHALTVSLHHAARPVSVTPPHCTPCQCHSATLHAHQFSYTPKLHILMNWQDLQENAFATCKTAFRNFIFFIFLKSSSSFLLSVKFALYSENFKLCLKEFSHKKCPGNCWNGN